jgi:hypothetical protein
MAVGLGRVSQHRLATEGADWLSILVALQRAGCWVWTDGERLFVRPTEAVTPELQIAVRTHKWRLVAWLQECQGRGAAARTPAQQIARLTREVAWVWMHLPPDARPQVRSRPWREARQALRAARESGDPVQLAGALAQYAALLGTIDRRVVMERVTARLAGKETD